MRCLHFLRKAKPVKKAIVIGSGAGGATAARELQGKFDVTILEAGKPFKPLKMSLASLTKLKRTGLLFDEKLIQLIFPSMRTRKGPDGIIFVNGRGSGGTTTICTGNALRADSALKALGIDLDEQFAEIYREIPITNDHREKWRPATHRLFEIFREMGLDPFPTPKMGYYQRCQACGRCVLGCPNNVKWDSRKYLEDALRAGATFVTKCPVQKIEIKCGAATGVIARKGTRLRRYEADLIIIGAGGFGTPVVLERSGIKCEKSLFVDPVLTLAARVDGCKQDSEIPMPFIAQYDNFIISPYFDLLSYYFNRNWNRPAEDIMGLMIKLADDNSGDVHGAKIDKSLSAADKSRLDNAAETCREILSRFGIKRDDIFQGTINAGHPGGMLPLSAVQSKTLHDERLPENVYVADSTLFPKSLGNPPILTICAIAKKIAGICKSNLGN